MPYIRPDARHRLDPSWQLPGATTPGELNYQITRLCNMYLQVDESLTYGGINDVVGVLECAKQEFYRRVAVSYEKQKISENGDVYE